MEHQTQHRRNKKFLIWALVFVVIMFFFGYGLVPIYNVMCRAFGINGKTNSSSIVNQSIIDKSRTVTVQFLATNNANLPWEFHPMIKKVDIHPGENVKLAYFAKNNSNKTMTVQAIPSVTPGLAAAHLKKTECFCFNQQTLKAHESTKMPIIFHLDNSLPKNIHEVTLSYTLFESKKPIKNKQTGKL